MQMMRHVALASALILCVAAKPLPAPTPTGADKANPTCPAAPDWGGLKPMRFTVKKFPDKTVLLSEGAIDQGLIPRLTKVLSSNAIDEIWMRSPGGVASVGNDAGRLIRKFGIPTRVPKGWTCFSSCNFMFMGGPVRAVEPGAVFMVHMFTHVSDRGAIDEEVSKGTDNTIEMIAEFEQDSALLASDDNDFLIRMGISRKLLTEIMYQQQAVVSKGSDNKSTRRCLTQDELFKYNVANLRE
jgi:hypothetical protein